jgi:copper chaperone CopZ
MKDLIKVSGMHCSGCEMNIQMALEEKEGIKKVKANHKKAIVEVEYDDKKIGIDEIKKIIKESGYEPE